MQISRLATSEILWENTSFQSQSFPGRVPHGTSHKVEVLRILSLSAWLDHTTFLSGNKNNNVAINILSESSSFQILFKRWVLIEYECRCATDVSTVEEWNILTTDIDSGCLSVSLIQSCGYDCISWRDPAKFQGVFEKIQVGKWTR